MMMQTAKYFLNLLDIWTKKQIKSYNHDTY